jgi:hypothetical protein
MNPSTVAFVSPSVHGAVLSAKCALRWSHGISGVPMCCGCGDVVSQDCHADVVDALNLLVRIILRLLPLFDVEGSQTLSPRHRFGASFYLCWQWCYYVSRMYRLLRHACALLNATIVICAVGSHMLVRKCLPFVDVVA